MRLFGEVYNNRTVLITGHTGFKGSWLALWLKELGANVIGYSLNPPTNPSHFDLLSSSHLLTFSPSHLRDVVSVIGDIRDAAKLNETFQTYKPEIVFHLAAQPLVRYSYKNPVETFETNVMGTINVFEACRQTESVKAIVNITSDKCYENRECAQGYCENDPMGGYDPYSASKGCAELVTNCYRRSFFTPSHLHTFSPSVLLSSARAGNVIGGGDWAEDRLVPDIMRAVSQNE
ncbi:MAG: CDP-glucose 4,6-dehydratase, partial [Dissulfurispiraceae bacterium]